MQFLYKSIHFDKQDIVLRGTQYKGAALKSF